MPRWYVVITRQEFFELEAADRSEAEELAFEHTWVAAQIEPDPPQIGDHLLQTVGCTVEPVEPAASSPSRAEAAHG